MTAVTFYLVGFVAIGFSFPVEGWPGDGLAVLGVVLICVGWRRVVRAGHERGAR